MAPILLPSGMRVVQTFEYHGEEVINVFHATTTDPIDTAKLAAIGNIFRNWWNTDAKLAFSHDIALTLVTSLDLSVANGEKYEYPQIPPIQGSVATPAEPNNVAWVASHRTAKTGRSFAGRTYHAGVQIATVTNNDQSAAVTVVLAAAYVALNGYLSADNNTLVVASFYSGGVPRATGIGTPVTGTAINTQLDTQRRRMPG